VSPSHVTDHKGQGKKKPERKKESCPPQLLFRITEKEKPLPPPQPDIKKKGTGRPTYICIPKGKRRFTPKVQKSSFGRTQENGKASVGNEGERHATRKRRGAAPMASGKGKARG